MRATAIVCIALAACSPVASEPEATAVANTCPEHACSAYTQPGAAPACIDGQCRVSALLANTVILVSLAEDSYFAPGRTFAVSLADLEEGSSPADSAGATAHLRNLSVQDGAYTVSPQVQRDTLHFPLNDVGIATTLPVTVTYRPLWPLDSATAVAEASTLGLPLDPITTESVVNQSSPDPGPAGGPSYRFRTYLQPGHYERTIAPKPPLDRIFPPDVSIVNALPASGFVNDLMFIDSTKETTPATNMVPTFDLSRAKGFDGWTTCLRDQTTKRRISNLALLHGTTQNVVLATNHHPPDMDALHNAELVMVPPPGDKLPTGVFAPTGGTIGSQLNYLPVPPPATVTGTIASDRGGPVEADLVFEAMGIYAQAQTTQELQLFPTSYFEYTGQTTARLQRGVSRYSIQLPPGRYRLTVRPLPGPETSGVYAVKVLEAPPIAVEPQATPVLVPPVTVSPQVVLSGTATVWDGRALPDALVEGVPLECTQGTLPWCLPRWAPPAVTNAEGWFQLALDPGTYAVRVRPREGTGFPWVTQTVPVGLPTEASADASSDGPVEGSTTPDGADGSPADGGVAPRQPADLKPRVPAPVYAGMTLLDVQGNPIVNAIVRAYRLPADAGAAPASGAPTSSDLSAPQAVEIGRAITDATGHYDMLLAP
jgi:hypothetical protein